MEITTKAIERLEKSFEDVHDQRRQSGNLRHKLLDMLVIAFTALLCGLKDYEDMENLGREKAGWFKTFLELPHGIPDKNTFQRLFTWIDPGELLASLGTWLEAVSGEGQAVNIDGKTIRGSKDGGNHAARHVVSAWVGEQHLTLGQVQTEEKGNEITVIPALLALLDLKGATVTIDAMGCQKAIAEQVAKQQGWYVLAVKENHPELYHQIAEYFRWVEEEKPRDELIDVWKSGCEKDHGRIERREVRISGHIDWLYQRGEWKGLQCIVAYRCSRWVAGKETVGERYYISNVGAKAEQMGRYLRKHWSIENELHWVLDVVFGEDGDRKRKDHAPENLNVVRKGVIALLRRREPEKKTSYKRLMFKALMKDDYRSFLLFGG
jgi:predicted transposase YbfD/YdcC